MTSVALYVLSNEYQAAAAQLADLDLDEQTVADTLESLAGELEHKATNVAMFVRSLDVTVAAMRDAEQQMRERRQKVEKRQQQITDYLKSNMERCGITKIDGPNLRLAIRTNPPALHIDDEAQVPGEYWIQPPLPAKVIEKAALKAAIISGADVPGAHVSQGTRLEIKV